MEGPKVLDFDTHDPADMPGLKTVCDDKSDWKVSACHFIAAISKLGFACIGLKYADILHPILNGL